MNKKKRTENLLAYFRGMPDEFGALKGILLIDTPEIREDAECLVNEHLDRIEIAKRIDAILRGEK